MGVGLQTLSESHLLQNAREGVSIAATTARGALCVASERVSGAAALAMSPMKLAQFAGVFFLGSIFVMVSLNFLPFLLIAPQRFSVLFTVGSLIMLSSFVILSGPWAFAKQLVQRKRLPYTAAYVIGLFGTLWATILMRSYPLTALFAIVQACSLIYFVADSVPGGRASLRMLCQLCSRSARSIAT